MTMARGLGMIITNKAGVRLTHKQALDSGWIKGNGWSFWDFY